jgi:hypothetical protein
MSGAPWETTDTELLKAQSIFTIVVDRRPEPPGQITALLC